jgi:hypothetical protein
MQLHTQTLLARPCSGVWAMGAPMTIAVLPGDQQPHCSRPADRRRTAGQGWRAGVHRAAAVETPVQRSRRLLPRCSSNGTLLCSATGVCCPGAAGSRWDLHVRQQAFAAHVQQQAVAPSSTEAATGVRSAAAGRSQRSSSSSNAAAAAAAPAAGGQPRQQGGRYQRPGVGRRGRRLSGWGDVLSSATTVAARPRRLGCRMRQAGGALASRALCKLATAQTTGGWSTLVRRRTCVVTKASSRSTQHVRVAWSLATATSVRQLGTVLLVTPCGNVQLTNVLRAASQLQSAVGPSPHARRHGCALLS